MKTSKLKLRSDLLIVEGTKNVKFSFPDMHSLFDYVEEIHLHSIEFNRRECTLFCKCTAQQVTIACKKYNAKVIEQD